MNCVFNTTIDGRIAMYEDNTCLFFFFDKTRETVHTKANTKTNNVVWLLIYEKLSLNIKTTFL